MTTPTLNTRPKPTPAKPPLAPRALPQHHTPTTSLYTITPAVAAHWLDTYNTHNRPLRERHVDALAGAILRGEWVQNGDPIRFSTHLALLDGQHRLAAGRAANTAIDAFVVTGLAPDSQITMDTGARRSFSDVLKLAGEPDALHLAALVSRVYQWQSGQVRAVSLRPSHGQLLGVLDGHPELRGCVAVGRRLSNAVRITASIGGLAWWLFSRIDEGDASFFVDRLCDGVGLTDGSPVLALRKVLINNAAARAKQPDFVITALVIKAWNAYRQGRAMQILTWKSGGAAPETFPEPV